MIAFETCAEDIIRARVTRRNYLIRAFRGWLSVKRRPRCMAAVHLAICVALAMGAGFAFAQCGLRSWSGRAFWSVLAVWPVYIVLARWRAGIEYLSLDSDGGERSYVQFDDRAEAARLDLYPGGTESDWRRQMHRAAGDGLGRSGLLPLLLIGSMSLGLWLLWELMIDHAGLLAQLMVDADHATTRANLIPDFELRDWRAEALGGTAIHFIGLAVAGARLRWSAAVPGVHVLSARIKI